MPFQMIMTRNLLTTMENSSTVRLI